METGRKGVRTKLHWDNVLDAWGVHGVGGFLGIVMLGMFATTAFNPQGANGPFAGRASFLVKQRVAVIISSAWTFLISYVMLVVINKVTPVRVEEMHEEIGLDEGLQGRHAYL